MNKLNLRKKAWDMGGQKSEDYHPGSNTGAGPAGYPHKTPRSPADLPRREQLDKDDYSTLSLLERDFEEEHASTVDRGSGPEAQSGGGGQSHSGEPGKIDNIYPEPSNRLRRRLRPFQNLVHSPEFNTGWDTDYTQRQLGDLRLRRKTLALGLNPQGLEHVCAWCRRAFEYDINGVGTPVGEILPDEVYNTAISHGICSECKNEQLGLHGVSKRAAEPTSGFGEEAANDPNTPEAELWELAQAVVYGIETTADENDMVEILPEDLKEQYADIAYLLHVIHRHPNFTDRRHRLEVDRWMDNLVRQINYKGQDKDKEGDKYRKDLTFTNPQSPKIEEVVEGDEWKQGKPSVPVEAQPELTAQPLSEEEHELLANISEDEIWEMATNGDPVAQSLIQKGLIASINRVLKQALVKVLPKKASILDAPRGVLDSKIWQEGPTGIPMLRPNVKLELVERFFSYINRFGGYLSPELWVKNMFYTGSTATYRYNDNSDVDIHVVVDWHDMLIANPGMKKVTLDEVWQDLHDIFWWTLNKLKLDGTKHPVQYYVVKPGEEKKIVDQREELYDIGHDVWLIPPYEDTEVPEAVMQPAAETASEIMRRIDQQISDARKGLIDFALLTEIVTPENAKDIYQHLSQKVSEIDDALNGMKEEYRDLKTKRQDAFVDNTVDSNFSLNNVIFKFVERYKYMDVLRKVKRLTDDVPLAPDQVPDLAKIFGLKELFEQEPE